MFDFWNSLDVKIQAALISGLISFTSIFLTIKGKIWYEKLSLNYRLDQEFKFEQRKKLKEDLSKNKMHHINAVESLSHRIWNFVQNIDRKKHSISEGEWGDKNQYYINSFIYRFLEFLYWTLKVEKDAVNIDTTNADPQDIKFLKYIKTFKDIFTDIDLFKSLNYNPDHNKNHFFKNDLVTYSKWIINDRGEVMDFDEFKKVLLSSYDKMKVLIEYFTNIKNSITDPSLNALRCFHFLAIDYLNKYGHDYQKTDQEKLDRIVNLHRNKIAIKSEFLEFIKKSKLDNEIDILIDSKLPKIGAISKGTMLFKAFPIKIHT
ncbi:hypothetical protein [Ekhidna sp.]|uniref:hypothetical protein n=1 Tax=Ekhidna sp. TaxID=2608089 RepID=UPI003C79AA5F